MKAFLVLIVIAIMLGGGMGGAFIAFAALGENEADEVSARAYPTPRSSSLSRQAAEQPTPEQRSTDQDGAVQGTGFDPQQIRQLRERFQSGELTREQIDEIRRNFRASGGPGRGQGGFGGLLGTIDSVDGSTVTVSTAGGARSVEVGEDTAIRVVSEGGVDQLETEMRVSIVGERGDDGVLVATTIIVVPDRADGFGGGGGARQFGFGQSRGEQSPGGRFGGAQQSRGAGSGSGRALLGTIESIEDGSITIETAQGSLPVTVGPETVVRLTRDVELGDLEDGMTVVVRGQPDDEGIVEAVSMTVVPEGLAEQFQFGGGGRRQGQ